MRFAQNQGKDLLKKLQTAYKLITLIFKKSTYWLS